MELTLGMGLGNGARAHREPGDKVSWGTSGEETRGTVEKKVTGAMKVKGHTAKATREEPQFVVKSAFGKTAVHKPDDLKKG